jgi:hypothetical protein
MYRSEERNVIDAKTYRHDGTGILRFADLDRTRLAILSIFGAQVLAQNFSSVTLAHQRRCQGHVRVTILSSSLRLVLLLLRAGVDGGGDVWPVI